ncbi:MAG: J domain-containing protein [Planctomycetales bacterium]|nr:J domain-containing protein [Planctomycetales bacterium]
MADDYYKLLDVSKTATQAEIQKSYRKLARKYHPDLNPDDKVAQQKFKDIQNAYEVLNDPEKRKMYDQFGPQFERMAAGGAHPGGPGGFSFEDIFQGGPGGGGFQFEGDIGDIFRQFTGGGAKAAGGRKGRAQAKGADLSAELTVPFNTAVLGGEASIALHRGGKYETIAVKIPPGVETGKKIRLRGQGENGPAGKGDLLITMTVASHPYFKRQGENLELKLPITLGEAALGATVDVPTPSGTIALRIPPGSSGGRRLRIKGQGVRGVSGAAGDMFVELQIKLPEQLGTSDQLDEKIQQAVEQIEKLYTGTPRSGIIW